MRKANITIDAKGKKLGRLASEVALVLRGKTSANYLPHVKDLPKVSVKNIDLIEFSEKRLREDSFLNYSGYPGGLRKRSAWEMLEKNNIEVLKRAIAGMLPKNKLKKLMLINLDLRHGENK